MRKLLGSPGAAALGLLVLLIALSTVAITLPRSEAVNEEAVRAGEETVLAGNEDPSIVLDEVGEEDQRGHPDHARVDVGGEPYERGQVRHRVRGDVMEQRPPRHRIATQAVSLVGRLPVGLEQIVACQVTDDENCEDLDPWHRARLPLLSDHGE